MVFYGILACSSSYSTWTIDQSSVPTPTNTRAHENDRSECPWKKHARSKSFKRRYYYIINIMVIYRIERETERREIVWIHIVERKGVIQNNHDCSTPGIPNFLARHRKRQWLEAARTILCGSASFASPLLSRCHQSTVSWISRLSSGKRQRFYAGTQSPRFFVEFFFQARIWGESLCEE